MMETLPTTFSIRTTFRVVPVVKVVRFDRLRHFNRTSLSNGLDLHTYNVILIERNSFYNNVHSTYQQAFVL